MGSKRDVRFANCLQSPSQAFLIYIYFKMYIYIYIFFVLQGAAGLPGPPGPVGLPVSVFYCTIHSCSRQEYQIMTSKSECLWLIRHKVLQHWAKQFLTATLLKHSWAVVLQAFWSSSKDVPWTLAHFLSSWCRLPWHDVVESRGQRQCIFHKLQPCKVLTQAKPADCAVGY